MVTVYYFLKHDGVPVVVSPASFALIPDDEMNDILGKTNKESRTDTLAGRILLRRILQERFGISPCDTVIAIRENGKPYLRDHPEICFSISHTKNCVACAVGKIPIGIDVETVSRKDHSRVAARMFTDNEKVMADKGTTEFFRIWTMKESFAKMVGDGIFGTSRDFDVLSGHGTNDAVFVMLDIPGAEAHLCMAQKDEVSQTEISEL